MAKLKVDSYFSSTSVFVTKAVKNPAKFSANLEMSTHDVREWL